MIQTLNGNFSLSPEATIKWRNLLQIFRTVDGRPFGDLLTQTQITIIAIIANRMFPRVQLILPTQYGKSEAVAQGVLLRAAYFPEPWAIVAPTEDKARIIMDYIIDHIFDDITFLSRLEYSGTKERLKQERSKTRITFRGAGEVRVFTAAAGNTKKVVSALMGFGAPNIVLDENYLIPDNLYATVKRMLGGHKDNFLLEIGNPFYRNHGWRTWNSDRYVKIFVDVWAALKEGRYTEEYIKEMEEEAFFETLYLCQHPEENEIRADGYRRLFLDALVDNAFIGQEPELKHDDSGKLQDKPILGIDPAHGGRNKTLMAVRYPKHNFAKVVRELNMDDTTDIVDEALLVIDEYGIGDYRIAVDAGGVGAGVADGLKAKGKMIRSVLFGEAAENKRYANMRAELYWGCRSWLKDGGKLIRNDGWQELKVIHYKETSTSKLQIEPKETMAKRGVPSPDYADALALTFINTTSIVDEEDVFFA